MTPIQEWDATFEKNINAVKKKISIYEKELARYDALIPRDKVMFKYRILELRELIEFYDDILYKYNHPESVGKEEVIGDAFISAYSNSKQFVETEYGDFPVFYKKSKNELMAEYFNVINNLNSLKVTDKNHSKMYKKLSQEYYFRYALLIKNAPLIKKGEVQNQILNPGSMDDYQKYVNEYQTTRRLAICTDLEREELVSKYYELKEQLMNFSSKNGIEKNRLKAQIADLECYIISLKAKHDKYDMLSQQGLLRINAVQGKISRDCFAYLMSRIDSDDRVNREMLNIQSFNSAIDKNEAELRILALQDNPDEQKRSTLVRHGETLEKMKTIAESDLSRARKNRLKREILHAYNVESISLEERDAKLALLDSYVVVNEAVEREVSIYTIEEPEYTTEETKKVV